MTNRIDILEEEILRLDEVVMERLLWDHSQEPIPVLDEHGSPVLDEKGKPITKHHHIYWATDNYEPFGFGFFDEIEISSVTGKHRTMVRPRAVKSKEEQERRTKEKAEVFTPSWVCNAQNNLVDEAWFGRPNVFNEEYTDANGKHLWKPTTDKITFPEGKTWEDYVWDKRLEMACGEAPYLVSRYDTTTGEPIDDLNMRIGLLDRKLRVVGENVQTSADWLHWGKCALKSIYGFEWQGDNILLAREAVLYTMKEYYEEFCRTVLGKEQTLRIDTFQTYAYIISWNIFQMDGIESCLPMSGCKKDIAVKQQTTTLFDFDDPPTQTVAISPIERQKVYAKVADWKKDGEMNRAVVEFRRLKN